MWRALCWYQVCRFSCKYELGFVSGCWIEVYHMLLMVMILMLGGVGLLKPKSLEEANLLEGHIKASFMAFHEYRRYRNGGVVLQSNLCSGLSSVQFGRFTGQSDSTARRPPEHRHAWAVRFDRPSDRRVI